MDNAGIYCSLMEDMPALQLYNELKSLLQTANREMAALEARILFEDIAKISMKSLHLDKDITISREVTERLEKIAFRRCEGEPLGRILGYRDFWKDRFYLSPDTLEPRPDTETLIESVLESYSKSFPPLKILDLGTGTGCILLSLLREFGDARGVGIDISKGAVLMARQNSERLGLADRAGFLQGNWTDRLEKDRKFDLIVSNPPYIPSADIPNLQKEVRNHDPILALDGGNDGLTPYKNLLPTLKNHLEPQGRIFFEFGINQEEDIKRLAEDSGATLIRVTNDLGGIPRVVEISYGDK